MYKNFFCCTSFHQNKEFPIIISFWGRFLGKKCRHCFHTNVEEIWCNKLDLLKTPYFQERLGSRVGIQRYFAIVNVDFSKSTRIFLYFLFHWICSKPKTFKIVHQGQFFFQKKFCTLPRHLLAFVFFIKLSSKLTIVWLFNIKDFFLNHPKERF